MAAIKSSGSLLLGAFLVGVLAASVQRPALAQDVDTRALADKSDAQAAANGASPSGGGQSRTIYSQKHLSPHRMMHFGKRPLVVAPPSLFVPASAPLFDPPVYQTQEQPEQIGQEGGLISYNPLQQVFEETFPIAARQPHNRQLVDVVANLLEFSKQQQARECALRVQEARARNEQQAAIAAASAEQQQQQQLLQGPHTMKFLRLMDANGASIGEQAPADTERAPQEKRDGSSAEQAHQLGQPETGAQEATFSVVSRSLPMGRSEMGLPTLTRAHLSSLLYGRRLGDSPASMLNMGQYIKKAEPTKMTFMHFG